MAHHFARRGRCACMASASRHGYFHGRWSALFFTGDRFSRSPPVCAESTYPLPRSAGFDGQFYHAIAHDPLDLRGTDRYIDAPHIRYLRILLPALSYALGGGGPFWVDRAYRALELASLSLGVLCVGACCLDRLCASVYAATAGGLERASRAAGSLRPSRALEFAALSI